MTLGSPGHTGAALAVQPRRGVGYAAQTPTLGEQLFDHELNTPDPPGNSAPGSMPQQSAQRRRDVELRDDRPPDGLGFLPVGQRLIHCPPAQPGQDMVLGDTARVRVAELCPHPLPELAEPHGPPLLCTTHDTCR